MATQEVLTASLEELGIIIQTNVKDGYTLDAGYPMQDGWQYLVRMTKASPGRPKADSK